MSRTLSLWILAVALAHGAGCSKTDDDASATEREIAAFEQQLSSGKSFADACKELDVLCHATGFGCKAHAMFCQVPNKQQICQQLAAACASYPAACDVYLLHCSGATPTLDAGRPTRPDGMTGPGRCGDGVCEPQLGEDCYSCPIDCQSASGQCNPYAVPDGGPPPSPYGCGDGVCEPKLGEDCWSCPIDCGKC